MDDLRMDCLMRHENGNCTVIGGFCTAVNDSICEGLHSAYDSGYRAAALRANQKRENPKPMTNAQKIRGMSDEELAVLLIGGCRGSKCNEQEQNEYGSVNCYQCRLKWLQQPAEEEQL